MENQKITKSVQPRKQRKFRYNAPLHFRQKFMHVHLSADLRKKYSFRNIQLKKGDKVKVLRGNFKKKEGKVEKINLKQEKVFITGLERIKKEGSKMLVPFNPTNLIITELTLEDKKRKEKLESKNTKTKKETKTDKPKSEDKK